jgi:hypothetical protein
LGGPEVKFQSYDEWMWDPRFELTDTLWTELKKRLKYAMAMVTDRENWLIDFQHLIPASGLWKMASFAVT